MPPEGLLWRDASPDTALIEKAAGAVRRYCHKFEDVPDVVYINPGQFRALDANRRRLERSYRGVKFQVEIRPQREQSRNHFYVVCECSPCRTCGLATADGDDGLCSECRAAEILKRARIP